MAIEQALILLTGIIVALLAAYAAVLYLWHHEDKPIDGRWEIGCCVRTAHDPHHFLPGVWRISTHYNDGTSEWERIA
jgi:hypothetical protein